ncbi:hypothetical protein LCGC14_1503610 [marine sediment metagenome]|uniref:Uncharacterized protein n=1 Tax=marine sediment metagenome TaxID=412755 RepID=A0A0F9J3V8_9ZZZZ
MKSKRIIQLIKLSGENQKLTILAAKEQNEP